MRFFEVASVTNSQFRTPSIRTYAVVPLNEDSGIIEWINNTSSLRSILSKAYKDCGLSANFPEFRELQKQENFAEIFTEIICQRYLLISNNAKF
jgi:serine/threonine-protein kinase ATR